MTVRQPWAWAIAHGGKDVENRSRNIAGAYRGPVAIHAGLSDAVTDDDIDESALSVLKRWRRWWAANGMPGGQRGHIIAVADLTDVHEDEDCLYRDFRRLSRLYREDPAALKALPDCGVGGVLGRTRMCSSWAMPDNWHLILANPRPLPSPIPAKGRLGLWTLPDDVEAAVLAQLAGGAR